MIEVAFNDSTGGNLLACIGGGMLESQGSKHIITLAFNLDIGALKPGIESEYRTKLPGQLMLAGFPGPNTEEDLCSFGVENLRNWAALKKGLQQGEAVRVWYSQSPGEFCGMLNLCSLLQHYDNPVTFVECPRAVKSGKHWELFHGWGQVDSWEIAPNAGAQRAVDHGEICAYAERWAQLVEENAPLRAVISNNVISVQEDFYDFLIRRFFPLKAVRQATLISEIMAGYCLGVYSYLFEERIQKMVQSGEIIVRQDADEWSRRILSTDK